LLVFLPVLPPLDERLELLELERLGLGVALPAFWQRMFVVPDLPGRAGAIEEKEVRRDARIR
jgi:hypothetical protein